MSAIRAIEGCQFSNLYCRSIALLKLYLHPKFQLRLPPVLHGCPPLRRPLKFLLNASVAVERLLYQELCDSPYEY